MRIAPSNGIQIAFSESQWLARTPADPIHDGTLANNAPGYASVLAPTGCKCASMNRTPSFSATPRATTIPPIPPVITSTPAHASSASRVIVTMRLGSSLAESAMLASAPFSVALVLRTMSSTLVESAAVAIPARSNIGARSLGAIARSSCPASASPSASAT